MNAFHEIALKKAKAFKTAEAELLDALDPIDQKRMYLDYGCSSMHDYCLRVLKLSEDVTYNFIKVLRISRQVPELKAAIHAQDLSVSKARKIASVINPNNQKAWIDLAKNSTFREIEFKVAEVHPESLKKETVRAISDEYVSITIRVKKSDYQKIKRAQELQSKKSRRPVSVEETLVKTADEYVERHDPVKKAERSKTPVARRVLPATKKIPAQCLHLVNKRDQGRCQFEYPNGKKCLSSHFTEVHHIHHQANGGSHDFKNLITYCSGHHKAIHQ